MKAIWDIALNNAKNLYKNWVFWVMLIIFPLAELMLFNSVFSNINDIPMQQSLIKLTQLNPINMSFSFDKLAAGVLAQFIMIGSVVTASFIIQERENKILMRSLTMPITKTQLYLGYLLSLMLELLTVIVTIMLISSLFFNFSWGLNLVDIIVVTLLCIFLSSSLGFLVATLFKSSGFAGGLMSGVVILMTFFNGDMTNGKLIFNNSDLFTINKWIKQAYINLANGLNLGDMLPILGIILLLGIIFMGGSIILFRKESVYE